MPISRAQFAQAARADEKWVENAARTTGRPLSYTPEEARWFGIVRILTRDFAMALRRAAELADVALRRPATAGEVVLAESSDGSAALTIDLAREHSAFAAALSAALHHGGPRRRGRSAPRRARSAIAAAERHGVDVTLLESALERSPADRLARLDANAEFLRAIRPASPARRRP